jgi:hypothetical protein
MQDGIAFASINGIVADPNISLLLSITMGLARITAGLFKKLPKRMAAPRCGSSGIPWEAISHSN